MNKYSNPDQTLTGLAKRMMRTVVARNGSGKQAVEHIHDPQNVLAKSRTRSIAAFALCV